MFLRTEVIFGWVRNIETYGESEVDYNSSVRKYNLV